MNRELIDQACIYRANKKCRPKKRISLREKKIIQKEEKINRDKFYILNILDRKEKIEKNNPAASSGVSSVFSFRFTPRVGELYPKERLKCVKEENKKTNQINNLLY